ncbi:hypothetical protein BDV19DRAFT_390553 [Aspergillus venezuelensis]
MGQKCCTATSSNAKLDQLPTELLIQITSYRDYESRFQLRQVSRRLYAVFSPEIYRAPLIEEGKAKQFIANLTRDPQLAKEVHSLVVHYHDLDKTKHHLVGHKVLYAEALGMNYDDCCPDDDRSWLEGIVAAGRKYKQKRESAKLHDLFVKSLPLPVLRNLKVYKFKHPSQGELSFQDHTWWDLSSRDSIFLHPYLKRLTIRGGTMGDFCCFDKAQQHGTSLEELNLIACDLAAETLHKILALPRALRRLTFKGLLRCGHMRATGERQPYLNAILQQAHSLKILDVDFAWHIIYETLNAGLSLRALTALEELTTTTELLTGNLDERVIPPAPPKENPFPESLKIIRLRYAMEFWVTSWEGPWQSALRDWVASGALLNLAFVEFSRSRRDWWDKNLEDDRPESKEIMNRTNVTVMRQFYGHFFLL